MRRARMPGTIGATLTLAMGVLFVQWWPSLPPYGTIAALILLAALTAWRWPRLRLLAILLLGIAWAIGWGKLAMDARLPRSLEGRDFVVTGTLDDLPLERTDATSFVLVPEQTTLDGQLIALHGRLRLAWYDDAPSLPPCSRWRLHVRLKRPRGLVNPGGADSERSALMRGIIATGYVRDDPANTLIDQPWCIDRLRDAVAQGIALRVPDAHDAALLRAFTVGDTRALDQHDWEVARANGIPHLIAISGFHVGVAAVFGAWLVLALYWLWPSLALRWPRVQAQAAAALLVAGLYGTLAGLGLPTVRTLLMIAVVAWSRCGRRHVGGAHTLALAMLAMLLCDPLSMLAAGFWLSFVGVAFLMFCLNSRARGLRAFLHELSAGQLVMTLALLPLTMWFFGEASLVGALSNLIAVPVISFLIVPCALLGMLLLALCPPLAQPIFWLAARITHAQWWLLQTMADWPGAHWYLPEVRPWALLLATLGALWLFMPRGVPLRAMGLLLFLPLLWPPRSLPQSGGFQAWVLDVGQGLSVVVRTRDHALVYDAGARYPSDFDLGEAAVLPSLHALGIARLDLLMVSHADNDHAGGAPAVAAAFPQALLLAGEPERMPMAMSACHVGQVWQWDGVRFSVLSPVSTKPGGADNDRSCVLQVQGADGMLLLTGDISSNIEPAVAAAVSKDDVPLVLLVPHHGSRSSSSAPFIDALQPTLALVSAGWRNRFGHPAAEVVQRYAQAGVPLLNTAEQGAIQVDFPAGAPPQVRESWRSRHPRYWRE